MSDVVAHPVSPTLIYTRVGDAPRLGISGRFVALLIGATCLAVLIVAMRLSPSPDGMGTHQAMGFQACQFLEHTGLPCPSCGMTTSFAWFVRGNVMASFYVQPMGFVLALVTCAALWAAMYIAISGRPAHQLIRLLPAKYYLFPLMCFAIFAWGWKMLIHLRGIDGWK